MQRTLLLLLLSRTYTYVAITSITYIYVHVYIQPGRQQGSYFYCITHAYSICAQNAYNVFFLQNLMLVDHKILHRVVLT